MKKILFATTALVASAGVASAAEVKLTGYAEMGIIGGDFYDPGNNNQFHTDIDATFTMTGESDNGISFGASIDLDESDGKGGRVDSPAFDNRKQGGETIFISSGGATLTMGDTDGAFDKAMKEVNLAAGSIADDETSHIGFDANSGLDGTYDGQIARFDYAFSGLTASVSVEVDDDDAGVGTMDPVWGVGVAYRTDMAGFNIGVGLGYQGTDDKNPVKSIWGLSLDAKFNNGLSAAVNYSSRDNSAAGAENTEHYAIGLGYEMNAFAIGVNYGKFTDIGGVKGADVQGYGLAAEYDFGGGLKAQFGYGYNDYESKAIDNDSRYSLGLAMSF